MGRLTPLAAPARRLPAGVKLLLLAAASVGLFRLGDPLALAAAVAAVLALAALAGAWSAVAGLRPLALVIVLSFAMHAALGDWLLGLVVCLRIVALVILAGIVSAVTPLSEMLTAFERALAPLRRLGVPTRAVAVALAMTLRFAPLLAERWRTLGEAWRTRSPRRPHWRLLIPFVIGALDDADRAAEALAARGGFLEK